ncbi:MAG TPA: isoaspartyl peptidase/L-asparaginase [Longimicrobium sp.]|nr:isoaspartyl peptidase/L-asparaginase [Longimicrobium sp.]
MVSTRERPARQVREFQHRSGSAPPAARWTRRGTCRGDVDGRYADKALLRVGDAPITGAGTYANNRSCAVSATGTREYFICNTVVHSICALMEYGRLPLAQAADSIIMRQLVTQTGDGGVSAMDRQGNWAWPFNTSGMYRGRIDAAGNVRIEIFRE